MVVAQEVEVTRQGAAGGAQLADEGAAIGQLAGAGASRTISRMGCKRWYWGREAVFIFLDLCR